MFLNHIRLLWVFPYLLLEPFTISTFKHGSCEKFVLILIILGLAHLSEIRWWSETVAVWITWCLRSWILGCRKLIGISCRGEYNRLICLELSFCRRWNCILSYLSAWMLKSTSFQILHLWRHLLRWINPLKSNVVIWKLRLVQ